MKIITKNGKAITSTNGAVTVKKYSKKWGFLQTKNRKEVQLYDWIYKCISDGFAVSTRTINGKIYTVDGGNENVLSGDVHWLVIPMRQFNIPAESIGNAKAFNVVHRVCTDNQDLFAWACPVVGGIEGYEVVNDGEYLDAYKLQHPFDIETFGYKKEEVRQTILEIDEFVKTETGFSILDKPVGASDKIAVATALHDWIIENVNNNNVLANSNHWSHCAYNCLRAKTSQSDVRTTDCAGFSSAFQLLCEQYGVNCIQVLGGVGDSDSGATGMKTNHSWNMLSIELPIGTYDSVSSKWYGVDIRFNEYVKDGKVKTDDATVTDTRRYFMTKNIYSDTTNTTVNGRDCRQRTNNDIGYPVDVPTGYLQSSIN